MRDQDYTLPSFKKWNRVMRENNDGDRQREEKNHKQEGSN